MMVFGVVVAVAFSAAFVYAVISTRGVSTKKAQKTAREYLAKISK